MSEPFVSGFTFIKNGLTLGYPIRESIESIADLCDEVIINVGYDDPNLQKDDGTYQYLRDSFPEDKYKFVQSFWNPERTSKGLILSDQTNIALEQCRGKVCQYIQGDEVLHEKDLDNIMNGCKELAETDRYQGLVFKYLHFYGNVDLYKYTRNMYRREVRTIKNGLGIKSWLDAQGFRFDNGKKIKAKLIDATTYHYGWARKETVMQNKVLEMDKLYHGKDFEAKQQFEYSKIWGIRRFKGTHPGNMSNWIDQNRNDIDLMALKATFHLRNINHALADGIETLTGYRVGEYRNYYLTK